MKEDEQNEIDILRKGLQKFNQLRHEDHYQLQSLLEHNLKKIEGKLSTLGETINAKLGNIIEHITILDSNLGKILKSNSESIKESFTSMEKQLKNTSGVLNNISDNIIKYIEELKKEREEFEQMRKKEEARITNDMAVRNFYEGRNIIAIDRLKRASELDSSSLEILTNLGIALSMEKRNQEAKDIFKSVLERDPDIVEALSGTGLIMFNEGNIDGAIDIFKQAIEKDQGLACAHANLGFAYKEKEDINKAIENWEKAIDLDPGLTDVKEALALYKDRRVDGTGEISV